MSRRSRTRVTSCALLVPLALVATACSVDDSGSGSAGKAGPSASGVTAAAADAALRARLPEDIKARGTLIMGVSEYPPYNTFGADGSITGLVPDLAAQLSAMLGVRITLKPTTLDAVIPGIKSGRIDLSAPAGDFVERQAQVDFADFAQSSVTLMVNASGGFRPGTGLEVCGKKVGVEKGAGTQNVIGGLSKRCEAQGRPPVTEQTYPDLSAAALALRSGRLDAVAAPSASNTSVSEDSDGRFSTVRIDDMQDLPAATAIYGVESKKGNGLAPVIAAALRKLYATGTYAKLFERWGLPLSTVPEEKIVVNGSRQYQSK